MKGCKFDTDGDGNCHIHPQGCPTPETPTSEDWEGAPFKCGTFKRGAWSKAETPTAGQDGGPEICPDCGKEFDIDSCARCSASPRQSTIHRLQHTEPEGWPDAEMMEQAHAGKVPISSCMVCGKIAPFGVWHGQHPEIGVCVTCRDAALNRTGGAQ